MAVEQGVEHSPRRLFVKCGVYYYVRRVPKALQVRFQRSRVVLCLHTRIEIEALNAANRISVQLEMAGQRKPQCLSWIVRETPGRVCWFRRGAEGGLVKRLHAFFGIGAQFTEPTFADLGQPIRIG